jgi:hypothetical protein
LTIEGDILLKLVWKDCPIMTTKSWHYLLIPHNNINNIYTRRIGSNTVADFQLQLSYEQWDDVFGNNNVNEIFNNFLNTYLRYYYSSFTKKVINTQHNYKHWITTGIKTSWKREREFSFLCRLSNVPNLKIYYKRYCKLLSKVILTTKMLHYNRIILNSKNKTVTAWKIINYEKGKSNHFKNIQSLRIDNKEITNQNTIANIFNSYFLSNAELLIPGNNEHTNIKETNPISYLINSSHWSFPKLSCQYASTHEIEKIIKSLKSKNTGGILRFAIPIV